MITGYLRVSTSKQNLANQQDEIRRFAESRQLTIDNWVTEVASGKKHERDRKLGGLLRRMKRGDTIIVTEISRLSRTLTDVMAIMGKYCFDNSINSKILCFAFGLVAEIERNLISMRTKEALALRKSEGVVLGRKKGSYTKLSILMENRKEIIRMLDEDWSITDICKRLNVSRDTFTTFKGKCPAVQQALSDKEKRRDLKSGKGRTR